MKKYFFFTALLVTFMFTATFVFADNLGPQKIGDVWKYDVSPNAKEWVRTADGFVWGHTIYREGATFVKPHFSHFDLPEGTIVELYNPAMELINSYSGQGPRDLVNFWAMSVVGDEAYIECRTKDPKAVQFSIDNVVFGDEPIFNESICGTDDLENINCKTRTTQIMNNEKATGHIVFVSGGSSYVCTGSLVSANSHFLTNNHCIPDQTTCNTMDVYFEYETSSSASCTSNSASKGTAFSCDNFITTNASYDFGFMTLAGNPASSRGHVTLNPKNLTIGESLYIIQHPNGYPKKIAFGTCFDNVTAGNVSNSDCEYQIDTMGGSSGSPVFDANGDVVALHHWGGCGTSSGNQGVLMSKVYPYIESYLGGTPPAGHDLKVTVNITHTYIGDLIVTLTTPSSQTVTLHNKEGGSADNINTTYNVTGWDGVYSGYWTLTVSDNANVDTGTLNSWSVQATPDGGSTHNGSASDTPIAIPDNNATGISSTFYMY